MERTTARRRPGARCRREPRRGDRSGFTLVEAMVAILVLGVGLIIVSGMTMSVAQQSRASTYWTEQTMVGQEVMEYQIDKGYAGLTVGSVDTTVRMDGRAYKVNVAVANTSPRGRRVRLTVTSRHSADTATLDRLVHRPRTVPTRYTP